MGRKIIPRIFPNAARVPASINSLDIGDSTTYIDRMTIIKTVRLSQNVNIDEPFNLLVMVKIFHKASFGRVVGSAAMPTIVRFCKSVASWEGSQSE